MSYLLCLLVLLFFFAVYYFLFDSLVILMLLCLIFVVVVVFIWFLFTLGIFLLCFVLSVGRSVLKIFVLLKVDPMFHNFAFNF